MGEAKIFSGRVNSGNITIAWEDRVQQYDYEYPEPPVSWDPSEKKIDRYMLPTQMSPPVHVLSVVSTVEINTGISATHLTLYLKESDIVNGIKPVIDKLRRVGYQGVDFEANINNGSDGRYELIFTGHDLQLQIFSEDFSQFYYGIEAAEAIFRLLEHFLDYLPVAKERVI